MSIYIIAREEGWVAGLQGLDPRCCPYPKLTVEYNEWHSFQRKACDIIRWLEV